MDLFVLYLIGQLSSISVAACLVAIGFIFYAFVLAFVGHVDEKTELQKKAAVCCRFGLVLIIVAALLPSRETIMLMAAGKAVIEASKTDAAQSIAANSVKWLDGFVAEQAKKYEGNK